MRGEDEVTPVGPPLPSSLDLPAGYKLIRVEWCSQPRYDMIAPDGYTRVGGPWTPRDAMALAADLAENSSLTPPNAMVWAAAKEIAGKLPESVDGFVRVLRGDIVTLKVALDASRNSATVGLSCAFRSGCSHVVACTTEQRCIGPVLNAGDAVLAQARRPAPGYAANAKDQETANAR